ncbi:MAG: FAD-dependent oxidoreductase [Halobacteriales archaeon]|nr:FAD-dependent oxidoreductase [Halobacteriales archaeon]
MSQKERLDVGVVGAGASGLATAYVLREDADVTVYEKSGVLLGRGATREREGCVYDYGANYVKEADERVAVFLEETTEMVEVDGDVWTFDAEGNIGEGYDEDVRKLTHSDGVSAIGGDVLEASSAELRSKTRVVSLSPTDTNAGVVIETEEARHGHDAVVVTPPAPQTAAVLRETIPSVAESVAEVEYTTVLSVVLRYPFELDVPWYGLVNTDKEHDVGWLSCEERKPGHVPDGSLLVVQASPEWSEHHYDDASEEVADALADSVAEILNDTRLRTYDWYDHQRWRYALALDGVDAEAVERAADENIYLAGDWVAGEARLHAVFRNGLETGDRIQEELLDA